MATPKLPLTPRALLEVRVPHSLCISPDGKQVVFAVEESDFEESRIISRLWIADTAVGNARRITHSYEGEAIPKWSPDGQWIAFLSMRPDMTEPPPEHEEEEDLLKEQIWILPVNGGEAFRLTNMREGVRGYEWAPDSKTIIFLAPETRPQPIQFVRDDERKRKIDPVIEHKEKLRLQFWEVGVEDKRPELLYTGDFGLHDFSVSPEGKKLAFTSNHSGEVNDYYQFDLYVLDLDSDSEPAKVVEKTGGKFQPRWSPDGKQLAFIANLDPELSFSQECVWVVPADGGEPVNLFASAPYDCHEIKWHRYWGGQLCGVVSDRTNCPLVHIGPSGIAPLTPAGRPVDCLDFDFAASSGEGIIAAAILEDDQSFPEVYILDPDGKKTAITQLNTDLAGRNELPRQEVINWTSSDGLSIEGVLTYPSTSSSSSTLHPLILQVHGGPKGHATNTLSSYHMHAALAGAGYLVLQPNYRGSEGYGNDFAVLSRGDLGGGDFQDLMAGVDHLVELGLADPERLGIIGASYGGYLTNWAITQTNRFAAAISHFGIFNLVSDYSNSEIARWDTDYTGTHYWEDPEIYRRLSPSTHLEKIKTPVLIIHGQADLNTFISNSREMYRALKDRGSAVEFVHYPREGHGLREPNHRLDEMRRCLEWFRRYLNPGGEPLSYGIGDRIEHDGYELVVSKVDEPEYTNWHEDWGRLLEVSFSIASKEAVEAAWRFELADVRLVDQDGRPSELRGVPLDIGGGRTLVSGDNLVVEIHPDKDTGRISVALAASYLIPETAGEYRLAITDFPHVGFAYGAREKPEMEEIGDQVQQEPETSN